MGVCLILRLHLGRTLDCLRTFLRDQVTRSSLVFGICFDLMPCAVLARGGEDFETLERLMPYAFLAHAGEDFEPLEKYVASCHLIFDMASCHLKRLCAV